MSLRRHLQEGTRELHQRLDRAMGGERFGDEAAYRRFLHLHAAVLPAAEAWLVEAAAAGVPVPPDLAARLRTPALLEDLAAMRDSAPARPERTERGGGVATAGAVLGRLYVLEGSRLGAQVLRRSLDPRWPSRFLAHGEGQRLWPLFLSWLDAQTPGEDERADAVASARALFAAYLAAAAPDGPARCAA